MKQLNSELQLTPQGAFTQFKLIYQSEYTYQRPLAPLHGTRDEFPVVNLAFLPNAEMPRANPEWRRYQ